MIKIDKP